MAEKSKEFVVITESYLQGLLSDLTTFGVFLAAVAVDKFYIGGSAFYKAIFGIMFICMLTSKASRLANKFHSKQEAIAYIESLGGGKNG